MANQQDPPNAKKDKDDFPVPAFFKPSVDPVELDKRSKEWRIALYNGTIIWQAVMAIAETTQLWNSALATPQVRMLLLARHSVRLLTLAMIWTLKHSVEKNLDSSETYKRMNLGIVVSSQLMTAMYAADTTLFGGKLRKITLITYYIQYLASLLAWWMSVGGMGFTGIRNLPGLPFRVLKSASDFVFEWKKKLDPASWYYAIAMLASVGVLAYMGFGPVIITPQSSDLGIFLYRAWGREELPLALCVFFNQWSAAQRDRLNASTFRLLNLALAAMFLIRLVVAVSFMPSVTFMVGSTSAMWAVMGVLAVSFLVPGLLWWKNVEH